MSFLDIFGYIVAAGWMLAIPYVIGNTRGFRRGYDEAWETRGRLGIYTPADADAERERAKKYDFKEPTR